MPFLIYVAIGLLLFGILLSLNDQDESGDLYFAIAMFWPLTLLVLIGYGCGKLFSKLFLGDK